MKRLLVIATAAVAFGGVAVAPAPAGAAYCWYRVQWSAAGVYETPTRTSTKIWTYYQREWVPSKYGNNWVVYNSSEGENYVAVDEPWAQDGIGWMRQNAVSTHC